MQSKEYLASTGLMLLLHLQYLSLCGQKLVSVSHNPFSEKKTKHNKISQASCVPRITLEEIVNNEVN